MLDLFGNEVVDDDLPDCLDLPDFEAIWVRSLAIVDLDDDFPIQQAEARQMFRSWHSDLCRVRRRRTPDRLQCGRRFTVGSIINLVDSVPGPSETR